MHRQRFSTALATACTLALLGWTSETWAQVRTFDVPADEAAVTIPEFARQAGIQIVAPADQLAGVRTPPLAGELDTKAALLQLIEGTGLRIVSDQDGVYVLRNTRAAVGRETSSLIELEELVVVGTRISNVAPTSPVISYDRGDIERGGYASVEDLLAKTPQNFAGVNAGTPLFTGGNVGFTTQIDLRGLGSEATLSLVNGRRVSSAAGDDGRAVDISMIPISAIERIDILTDGASALYGSEAIGGVVNIVLRKDFEGAETTVQYGDNSTGSDDLMLAQVLGTSWGTGRALLAAQYVKNESLSYRDIGIEDLDFRGRGGGDHRLQFIGSPGTVLPAGFFDGQPFTILSGPGGEPVFFAALPPGDGRSLDINQLRLNEATASGGFFDHILPEQENVSAYVTLEQDVGSVTLFADGVFSRRTALYSQGETVSYLFVPATNAYSPFTEDVMVGYQFHDFGSIKYNTERKGWFANLGARGRVGATDWSWEVLGTLSEDESDSTFQMPDRGALAMRLASSDPAIAFNPFGDGSGQAAGVIDALRQTITYTGDTALTAVSAQTQGALWDLPGGAVRLALGSEYREEELESRALQDGLLARDYYPGGVSRDISALFGELYFPLVTGSNARGGVRELTISAAARFERYSDFGDTTNPKLGILWRPLDDLAVKANWGTSFRAPSLRELTFISAVSPNIPAFDPNAPGGPATVFIDLIQGGNPNLKEETAETYTVSLEYTPSWLEGARMSATYYRTDYKDRIRGFLDGLDWNMLLQLESGLPPGLIERAPDGTLLSVDVSNINSASTLIAGYDVLAGYSWSTGRWGNFDLSATATYRTEFKDRLIAGAPVLDLAGVVGSSPDWRGRVNLLWFRGPWTAALAVNHTDSLWNEDVDPMIVRRAVDSQTTVDVQLGFKPEGWGGTWLHGVTARIGATNLLDERPPFVDGQQRRGFDVQNAIVEGRTIYLRLSKGFGAAARP